MPRSEIRVEAWGVKRVRARIAPGVPFACSPAEHEEWERLCHENDRLHDGAILAVTAFLPDVGEIQCVRSSYKEFVTAPALGRSVQSLGASGIVSRGGSHTREYLIGRRGSSVRLYPGLWETAPRGTVDGADAQTLSLLDLANQLRREAREELAWDMNPESIAPVAIVHDETSRSVDVCIACRVQGAPDSFASTWEYPEARWVRWEELARGAYSLSPPCEALVSALTPPCSGLERGDIPPNTP
jgi:hypothetical protein